MVNNYKITEAALLVTALWSNPNKAGDDGITLKEFAVIIENSIILPD